MEAKRYRGRRRDGVDGILEQWARERPELDTGPMALIGRIHRVGVLLEAELRPVFAEAGLGSGDFDVLATLRRAGSPYRLSPSQLSASTMVTSGAATKRVDRLERAGLVRREASPRDGRGRDVSLTRAGRRLVDRVVERHLENERRVLSALSDTDREHAVRILRRLLVSLGDEVGPEVRPLG